MRVPRLQARRRGRPPSAVVPAPRFPRGANGRVESVRAASSAARDLQRRSVPPPTRVPEMAVLRSEPPGLRAQRCRPGRSSPVVRKLALEHGVDLDSVRGSGDHGRITANVHQSRRRAAAHQPPSDRRSKRRELGVTCHASQELAALLSTGVAFPVPNPGYGAYQGPPYRAKEGDQVVPFTRRRRITADHMVYSKFASPHVVTVAECDLFRAAPPRGEQGSLQEGGHEPHDARLRRRGGRARASARTPPSTRASSTTRS